MASQTFDDILRNNECSKIIHEGVKDKKNQLLKTVCDKICEVLELQDSLNINLEPVVEEFKKVVKVHKCEQCNKTFSWAGVLRMHIRTIHNGHKDYKCESCTKSFSQVALLKKHIIEDWHSLAIRKTMFLKYKFQK